MTNNSKKSCPRCNPAFKDAIIILSALASLFMLSYYFNFFAFLAEIFQNNPDAFIWIDEIIIILLVLSVGSTIFAWRRWLELKKEAARRIRLQEELIALEQTKAEAADIVSKQLRSEIEYHRKTSH